MKSEQIRAARALLRWEQADLAERSGVSLATIKRLETQQGAIEGANRTTLAALRLAIEAGGVVLLDAGDGGGPGARLRG